MKRWHQDAAHSRRENVKHLRQAHGWPRKPVDCVCDVQVGRFRKTKGLGCPQGSKCICKWGRKGAGAEPTKHDLIADIIYREFADGSF